MNTGKLHLERLQEQPIKVGEVVLCSDVIAGS